MKRRYRCAVLAAVALSLTGCRGCVIDLAAVDALTRTFHEQIYLYGVGPTIIAGAIGTAATPGGWGGVSVMSTELAWREWFWTGTNRLANEPRNAGSVIGMAAMPGGLYSVATAVGLDAHVVQFPTVQALPCLFEIQPILGLADP
jgi:hypothetical protein